VGARCTVCLHPDRPSIELALSRKAGLKTIAAKFGLSKTALSRHSTNHMPPQVKAVMLATGRTTPVDLDELRRTESEGLLATAVALRARLYRQLDMAEEVGDLRAAASLDGRILDSLSFVAKLLGEISTHTQTTITQLTISPEYLSLRAALVQALQPYPEARKAVSQVIRRLEGVEPHYTGVPLPKAPVIDQEPSP
jgi:hypothetical protein